VADFFVSALALRYDGTNGAAICAAVNTINAQLGTFLGWDTPTCVETAGVIDITTSPFVPPKVVATGQWIALENSALVVYDNPVFQALHRRNQPNITTVASANVPGIAALGSVNVDVNLPLAFSGTGAYTATASLVGANANLSVGAITKLDVDTVRVRVDAALVYVSGAQVLVVATGDPA
jgi:hypothetical protein